MCGKDCENYKPVGKKACYKNKCDGCDCRSCSDNSDCETRISKCFFCKHTKPKYTWTYTTPTITYPGYPITVPNTTPQSPWYGSYTVTYTNNEGK